MSWTSGGGSLSTAARWVSGMHEFVLLLADGSKEGKGSGINVWAALEKEEMKRFARNVFEL